MPGGAIPPLGILNPQQMNKKTTIKHLERSLKPNSVSDDFKLDEIQWYNHYPAHPELIPFENSAKKIIEELGQEQAQAENELYNS